MGLVVMSKDDSLDGTMTSGGTDVIEMPPRTSRSTTGPTAVVSSGSGGANVSVDAGDSVEAGDALEAVGAVEAGESDDSGPAAGPMPRDVHETVSRAKARHHTPLRNG